MSHRFLAALVCVCLPVVAADVADAQARRGPPQRSGNGAIVGRVFDAATNTPIRRAQIQGTNNELFVDALSDDQGRFQLANLPPGDWRVMVGASSREIRLKGEFTVR